MSATTRGGLGARLHATVPVRYFDEMVTRCRASAETAADCLRGVGLDPEIRRVRGARLTAEQFVRAYRALLAACKDELFGFFERPVPVGSYRTLVRLLVGAADLGTALENGFTFYQLFDPHTYWRLATSTREARTLITVTPRDDGQAASAVFTLTMLLSPVRLGAWLVAQDLPVRRLVLDARLRAFASEARGAFGVKPELAARTNLVELDPGVCRMPIVRSASDARAYPRSSLDALIAPAPRASLEADLRRVLAASATPLALSGSARALGMSSPVLARRLAMLGTSFQKVKDEVRRDYAIALLRESKRTLAEIAEILGFTEASAFHRAFKRWTGMTPVAYRAALL